MGVRVGTRSRSAMQALGGSSRRSKSGRSGKGTRAASSKPATTSKGSKGWTASGRRAENQRAIEAIADRRIDAALDRSPTGKGSRTSKSGRR